MLDLDARTAYEVRQEERETARLLGWVMCEGDHEVPLLPCRYCRAAL